MKRSSILPTGQITNQLKQNIMTEKEANDILHEKYPQGYIRYNDLGRKHTLTEP